MKWAWLAGFTALCVIMWESLWRVSSRYYHLAVALLSLLAMGAGFHMVQDQSIPEKFVSTALVLLFYGFFLYILGQKYYMKEGFFELTPPGKFAEFINKQPNATRYQRFLIALPKILFFYMIALFLLEVIVY